MQQTLKLLKPLVSLTNESNDMLASKYQEFADPTILATLFYRHYKLILQTAKVYYGITEEDLASFALEKLDVAMLTYDPEKGTFTTYFIRVLQKRLREEQEAQFTHKRRASLFVSSYEQLVESGFEPIAPEETDYTKFQEELATIEGMDLNYLRYCHLIVEGYSNSEIAKMLNVSVMTLSNYRRKLRTILYPVLYKPQ